MKNPKTLENARWIDLSHDPVPWWRDMKTVFCLLGATIVVISFICLVHYSASVKGFL